jgi:hypothetical protein
VTGAEVAQAFELGSRLVPPLVQAIEALIALGHSREEATEIVIRDITSRADEYRRMKAEDRAALAKKHGVPDELVDEGVPPNPFEEP